MNLCLTLFLTTCALAAAADPRFAFHELEGGRLELRESGAPVFVYNYGPQLNPGVPEDRRRSSYLSPVYTPAGTIVTDDFPVDHYHHRGLFWAWPVVTVGDQTADLWTLKGVETRFERWLERRADDREASLGIENGWYFSGRRILREEVRIVVLPAASGAREFTVALTLTALDEPVTIGGAREDNKGYGGLSFRFAPRDQTRLHTSEGNLPKDEDRGRHAWAELEAVYNSRPAVLRITADPANPAFPNEWCLRHYGFVGANFPGARTFRLEPRKPQTLRYRVRSSDGTDLQ